MVAVRIVFHNLAKVKLKHTNVLKGNVHEQKQYINVLFHLRFIYLHSFKDHVLEMLDLS